MSIQWTIVAGFLYVEIGVVLLLTLPVFSAQRWSRIFKSRFLHAFGAQAYIYFAILLGVLVLFFVDAVREMRKYSEEGKEQLTGGHAHLDAEMQNSMKLFRAQRNFYISGFALFLSLVIRRLVVLISSQASLMAQCEASIKQAESASAAARRAMKESEASQSGDGAAAQNDANEAHDKEVKRLKTQLADSQEEVGRLTRSMDALKSQAASVNKEYDRLLSEYESLQKKMEKSSDGDKKSD